MDQFKQKPLPQRQRVSRNVRRRRASQVRQSAPLLQSREIAPLPARRPANVPASQMAQRRAFVSSFNSRLNPGPRYVKSTRDSKVVRHSEFLGSLPGSVALTTQFSFSVNPGLAATFPWLSLEAVGWERYRFKRCCFSYETATSTAATGDVIIAPDYDSADSAPSSEVVAMDYKDRAYGPPWATQPIVCELDPRDMDGAFKEHYVRAGALSANLDVKTYDVANVHFLTAGQATTATIGKMFCDYEVEFFNPQLPPAGSPLSNEGTLTSGGGSIAAATPFGAVPIVTGPIVLSGAATNVLTITGLTVGAEYCLSHSIVGTVITAAPGFNSLVGLTANTVLFSGFPAAATTANSTQTFLATATTASTTIAITATTVTTSYVVLTLIAPRASF